jgi:hypothetical protein
MTTRYTNQQPVQAGQIGTGHGGTGLPTATPEQLRALLLAITLVLAIAAGTGWLALRSLATGATYWPSKLASQQRLISLEQDTAQYWAATGLYAVVCLASLALALWGLREWWKLRQMGASHAAGQRVS